MTTPRQERISDLVQQEIARRELPVFLSRISEVFGFAMSEENALPWEVSENIRGQIDARVSEGLQLGVCENHIILKRDSRSQFEVELARRMQVFGSENVVLSLNRFRHLPLIQVQAYVVGRNFYALWSVGDSVVVSTADVSCGLMADVYPDDLVDGFEIVSWGVN